MSERQVTNSREIIWYEHHGREVAAFSDLAGLHRSNCLCYVCENFHPGTPENCEIAQENYELCVRRGLVLPVWECPEFAPLEADHE